MSQAALRLEVLFEAWLAEGRELRLSDRLELLLVRAKLLPVKAEPALAAAAAQMEKTGQKDVNFLM